MVCDSLDGKTWCGFRRKRVACCGVTTIILAAVVIAILAVTLQAPDDIKTVEQTDSEVISAGELQVQRQAVFASDNVNGTLSLIEVNEDNSSYVALNDFAVSTIVCDEQSLEVRLLSIGASASSADSSGVYVVPFTAIDIASDFIVLLGESFDVTPYDEAVIWCAETDSTGTQVSTTADLTAPTTVAGGSIVIREATLSGGGSYTTEGMVQILGTGSIADNALVADYSLRFQNIEVSSGPDVFLYLTTDSDDPDDVDAEGSLTVIVDGADRGTFSFTGNFSQTVPDGFVSPEDYVAAVVWCDQFDVFFGSGLFVDV